MNAKISQRHHSFIFNYLVTKVFPFNLPRSIKNLLSRWVWSNFVSVSFASSILIFFIFVNGNHGFSQSTSRRGTDFYYIFPLPITDRQRIPTKILGLRSRCHVRSLTSIFSSAPYFEGEDKTYEQTSSSFNSFDDDNQLYSLKSQHFDYLRRHKFEEAFTCIVDLMKALDLLSNNVLSRDKQLYWSRAVDSLIEAFSSRAFSPPFDISDDKTHQRVLLGVKVVNLQISSSTNGIGNNLSEPYNTVTKRTLKDALVALTSLTSKPENRYGRRYYSSDNKLTDEAFRVLQRLVTGVGVRQSQINVADLNDAKFEKSASDSSITVNSNVSSMDEHEFNRVLTSFSNAGRMEMVHRVLALQERTPHAPPLSPISYTILFKGCGRMRRLYDLELALYNAIQNKVPPDTILMNSLINAYVDCNELSKAIYVFKRMQNEGSDNDTVNDTSTMDANYLSRIEEWFQVFNCPKPNRRTYNIMLKGFAKFGFLQDAIRLAEEMKQLRLWDVITTNTVVHAYVKAGSLFCAEQILSNHTVTIWNHEEKPQHPNIEAYTELVNAYAKGKNLNKAISTFELMRQRGVKANDVTYNSLLNGFGRCNKIDHAKKMLTFMKSKGFRISTTSFNSLISGLVETTTEPTGLEHNIYDSNYCVDEFHSRVDQAMILVREMMSSGMRPNDITVTVLVDALGRCNPPRVHDACLLVEKCETKKFIKAGNSKVLTALVNAYGKVGDVDGATIAFNKILQPDTIAINSFMDCCCRCGEEKSAFKIFASFSKNRNQLVPNVISYSIVIDAMLRQPAANSVKRAQLKYEEMKQDWNIRPDTVLVDIILKAMLRHGGEDSILDKSSIRFVSSVIQDAENLKWPEGQLDRRKRAFRHRLRGMWIAESTEVDNVNDDLFKRKGWNKVNSGFRLWGGGRQESSSQNEKPQKCDFLEAHGWNNVDSGFRLF